MRQDNFAQESVEGSIFHGPSFSLYFLSAVAGTQNRRDWHARILELEKYLTREDKLAQSWNARL